MHHLALSVFALVLLVGLPNVMEAPTSSEGMLGAAAGALILAVVALRGVLGYVRSRKPKSYHDSIMPPLEPPK